MSKRVLEGAKLFCNKGSKSSSLKVTSQQIVKVDNLLVGTEQDKQTNINILPFGVCSVTQKSCIPSLVKWLKTSADAISSQRVLTNESYCNCTLGGKIDILHANYNGFAKYS